MNMMKILLTISISAFFSSIAFSQTNKETDVESSIQTTDYSYAYIRVQGKEFSKKLKVEVDFGDSQEQLLQGEKYSEILTNKKILCSYTKLYV